MRQTISGLVAAIAVVTASAAPAMACGLTPCEQPHVHAAPLAAYAGCTTGCGGWAHERLPDPVAQYHQPEQPSPQYYHVNQGPTYTGPGNWAPLPTYQEAAVSGWNAYNRPYYYGYDGGRYANATNHYYDGAGVEGPAIYTYRPHRQVRSWRQRNGIYYAPRRYHHSIRYGVPRYSGQHVVRRSY